LTDYSAFGLTLRVALAGDRRRCAASSNRIVYVGGSNCDRAATAAIWRSGGFFSGGSPGRNLNHDENTGKLRNADFGLV